MAANHIPVIDLSKLGQDTGDRLVDAVHKWGFAFVKGSNTGFTAQLINHIFDLSKAFFQSSQQEKERCAIGVNVRGPLYCDEDLLSNFGSYRIKDGRPYIPKHLTQRIKRAFNFGEFAQGKAQQPLPQALTAYEPDISDFADECRDLCMQLLRLFASGLKIDPAQGGQDWFAERHDASKGPSGSILRLLHYPVLEACPVDTDEATDVRAGAHSDYGSITLLFQRSSQPGLELLNPHGEWYPVPVQPPGTEHDPFPPILVNVGDLLSHWTNGFLKSTIHKVVIPPDNETTDRYSIAYFCHPANETRLTPVPSELVAKASASKEMQKEFPGSNILTAEEHLRSRLAATYGWDELSDKAGKERYHPQAG